jgi:pimeloyl-ACP methyl ester carboxylesterase
LGDRFGKTIFWWFRPLRIAEIPAVKLGRRMGLIHHVVSGSGRPPIVFVHGFGCEHTDWDAQVAHLSPRHQCVAVDLRGHGASPGDPSDCSVERYGADVAEVMRAMALPPAVLVGHSMGCRVVIEAALQAPSQTVGVILVDGSQFAAAMDAVLKARFATPDGFAAMVSSLFADMFTTKSNGNVVASVTERAARLPRPIGEKMLTDMLRYDVGRLPRALADLRVPIMVLQTTFSNEKRERASLRDGQTTPYLDMVRANVPSARIEIIADTGHFPQLDESARTNALIEGFLQELQVHW